MEIDLESVKRLHLEPGDTLVLTVSDAVDDATIASLSVEMKAAFPAHKTVVLSPELDLKVVSAPAGA